MKYVLVTGAFGGMGYETVKTLSGAGYTVFALDKKVSKAPDGVIPIPVDVTDIGSINNAFEKIKGVTDELYAIIHLAGIYYLDSLLEMSEERFMRIFDINVFGIYRINKIFAPLLKKGSKIIITSSELAPLYPLPFTGIYGITKTTVERYAYSLRMEVQLLGISVSVIRPGAVKTSLLSDSTRELDEFCRNTKLYDCNAQKFKKIVDKVEAKNVPPQKIAKKILKALNKKHPKYVYKINRNPLLLLLNILPKRWQTKIIGKILK